MVLSNLVWIQCCAYFQNGALNHILTFPPTWIILFYWTTLIPQQLTIETSTSESPSGVTFFQLAVGRTGQNHATYLVLYSSSYLADSIIQTYPWFCKGRDLHFCFVKVSISFTHSKRINWVKTTDFD